MTPFDVAFSLAGEQIPLIEPIAEELRRRGRYVEATPRIDHDSWADALEEPACVAAASTRAKVVICGGWRTFSTTLLHEKGYDNQAFLENVLRWLATRDSFSALR